jgi:hypothetical protein
MDYFIKLYGFMKKNKESAELAVETLNLVDVDVAFVLTGETKLCGK